MAEALAVDRRNYKPRATRHVRINPPRRRTYVDRKSPRDPAPLRSPATPASIDYVRLRVRHPSATSPRQIRSFRMPNLLRVTAECDGHPEEKGPARLVR